MRVKMHSDFPNFIKENVSYVKNLNQILNSKPFLVSVKEKDSFKKTFHKIKKSKKIDFVWVEKPKLNQMAAILLTRILGKKFFWVQGFSNPPLPNFFTKLLLTQADKIITNSKANLAKLKKSGIEKSKIRYVNHF